MERSWEGFFPAVAAWLGILVGLALTHLLVTGLLDGRIWGFWEVVFLLPGWIGLFLPFAAFAGGVAAHASVRPASILGRATLLSAISYVLLAWGSPMADYRARASQGAELEAEFPLGPLTPPTLVELRSRVEADPPADYTFRVSRPLDRPPNWLTYLLHSRFAVALFAILAALLGRTTGSLTSGLSPPARRNARWAVGLATGVAFFAAEAAGGTWVRSGLSNPGLAGAWLPLLVPAAGLVVVLFLARRRRRQPDGAPQPGVG